MDIRGNTFLIAGGGSGLGAACARTLTEAGGYVVIADVDEAGGARLAEELGETARFCAADVTKTEDVAAAIQTAKHLGGPLRGAINCAGILGAARVVGRDGPHDIELFTRVIHVNLIGTFNVLRLAAAEISTAPPTDDGERGVIVNTASVTAFEGQIGQAAYSASKGGVVGMMLPIARELARFGIRVVAIAPGVFDTPMISALPGEARAAFEAQVPFPPRLGRPSEFAELARHVIENSMLNGTTIRLDGALRFAGK
ncbi:MAG: SDR family NAD(P)-dependent oxidoreductase [Planctomycetes bacterium]|nr:SDR family NAD(P)-dependent oxidoreductase [Planctomycetota bacterium]